MAQLEEQQAVEQAQAKARKNAKQAQAAAQKAAKRVVRWEAKLSQEVEHQEAKCQKCVLQDVKHQQRKLRPLWVLQLGLRNQQVIHLCLRLWHLDNIKNPCIKRPGQ